MSIDDAWLEGANAADLEALAQALRDGRIPASFATAAVQFAGFDEGAARFLAGWRGSDVASVAWMLDRFASERRRADDRYAAVASLVWSGASEGQPVIRDTRVVLDSLFARARSHVLISTFVVYDGLRVFARLAERLRAHPEIAVELYVNLPAGSAGDEAADAAAFYASFAASHWPPDVPVPSLYYDPESRRPGGKRTTLHAKCVVVDRRWAFVTSANFTEAAQDRNIEAGVLLDHPRLADALATQFESLKASGRLESLRAPR